MKTQRIFLVGMPGSGKSTIGKKLSELMNIPFMDLDNVIEQKEERKIPEIFKNSGESVFRKVERKYLMNLIRKKNNFILSTGGGTPVHFDNMDQMNTSGITVFLHLSIEEIVERLRNDKRTERPLFAGISEQELPEKLREMYKIRLPYYQKAVIKYPGSDADKLWKLLTK